MSQQPHHASGMGLADTFSEALTSHLVQPVRWLLTSLGTALGVGAFLAVIGLSTTAAQQVGDRFDPTRATEVVVEANRTSAAGGQGFPADAEARVATLGGVEHAGVTWSLANQPQVRNALSRGAREPKLPVVVASPGYLAAVEPVMQLGRTYDTGHAQRGDRVAVLGRAAAAQLGISHLAGQPAVFVDETPFTVVGILDDVKRQPDLLMSVIISTQTATHIWGPPTEGSKATLLAATRIGAATSVYRDITLAIDPAEPQLYTAKEPIDPSTLRGNIDQDLATLSMIVAAVLLVIGVISIASTTFIAVTERTPELGLRRALGARPRHIAGLILTESIMTGLLGGLLGVSLGTVSLLGVCAAQGWGPVLEPQLLLVAPGVGVVSGLLAGLYPAVKASTIEPVEALRR